MLLNLSKELRAFENVTPSSQVGLAVREELKELLSKQTHHIENRSAAAARSRLVIVSIVCACTHVCMSVCLYVCAYVFMYVCGLYVCV